MNYCPQEILDLLPDYHLDQLPEAEAQQVRRALQDSPECRERLAEVSEVLDRLAFAAPPAEPPPSLKARVLAAALEEREGGAAEGDPSPPPPTPPAPSESPVLRRPGGAGRRWQTVLPYLGAAAAALLCVVFGLAYLDLRAENRLLREEVGSLRVEVEDGSGGEAGDAGLVVVPVEGTERASEVRGTAVADPRTGSLAFDAYNLPEAPEGHAYHAWLVGQNGETTHLGRMEPEGGEVRMTGRAPEPLGSYQALEITAEPLGEDDGEQDGPVYLQAELT